MVSAAFLRDPARDPEQALRRHRVVRRDRGARSRALARPLAGQVGEVSPDLPLLLLGVRRVLHRTWLARIKGADRGASPHRPNLDRGLLRLLSGGHAAAELYREDEADSGFDRGRGAGEEVSRNRGSRLIGDRSQGKTTMTSFNITALASGAFAVALAGGLALAQEDAEQPNPPRGEWSFAGTFGTFDQA